MRVNAAFAHRNAWEIGVGASLLDRSRQAHTPDGAACRRASTLIELVIALVLTAIIAGTSLRLLDHTARYARGTTLIAEERSQVAAASFALRQVVEELSSDGSDVVSATDSSAVWMGTIGHATACRVFAMALELPPEHLASAIALTWWAMSPQPGDDVAVLDEGATIGAADDRWRVSRLVDARALPNGCAGTPLVSPVADAGKSGWLLRLADTLPPTVSPGAPVRVRRLQRYALYRSSAQWMLGWTDWNAGSGGWNIIQPLAGPLQPYSSSLGASGLALAWLDSTGAPVALPSPGLASAFLSVRGRTTAVVRMDGVARGIRSDSLGLHVPLRNRR